MENKKNESIATILTVTFIIIFPNKLSLLLPNLMQSQFDLPYSKTLGSLGFIITIAYVLGALPIMLIKTPITVKREFYWSKIKRNQRILIGISFILNILIWLIFLYKAETQLLLAFSPALFADSMFVLLGYGLGIAIVYFIDFICKKVDKKAAKYGDDKVKENRFRKIVKVVVILCSVALVYFFVFMVR
ncbi:MAG: hypothetical protein GYA50_10670 [Eubacteriaceae bacterium]|nr:hypothetical protein [Eubacteriaceae bacterium]